MDYGIKLDGLPAEDVRGLARPIDDSGLDELWVVEDLGLAGGFAQAATLLAETSAVRVGLGISPAAVRNPAYLAMEIAALARMHPGRFLSGIGHGMPGWLRQVGAHPASLMTALEEVTDAVRRLLAGETVTLHGGHVRLDEVALTHPPRIPPTLHLGVRGPKGVALAARAADGVILAEGSGPAYVRSVRDAVGPGRRITVFAWLCLRPDRDAARAALRPVVERALGQEFMRFQLGTARSAEEALSEVTVSGGLADCVRQLEILERAGADAVVFAPLPGEEPDQVEALHDTLLPAIRR
ncbi:LLM class flavin-dependent oxidoreductase [Amycolatopsis sp. NPDC049691]|uniref:LLM class flavin-dependent oxidoreductase n=1 Tax=Amycolatopsis sp. NPDC049691 TaxID=3155155 RepID=UPI00343A5D03